MYKGKFDQKKKSEAGDIHELLSQRSSGPASEIPELKPAPRRTAPAKSAPERSSVPERAVPARAAAATAVKKAPPHPVKKKGPRMGGVIFYTLYFLFILLFFVATYIGLQSLQRWLTDYEAAQPTVKCQQVFDQLFTHPDWDAIYEASGAKDSPYEGKEAFVSYMEDKVGNAKLSYLETSAGLSGNKKYIIRLGNEKIAAFTLVDKNNVGTTSLENFSAELPDWQLGSVEVFFSREGSYRIVKMDGHTAYVNGVSLDDSFIIQIATTKAEDYLPTGTTGISLDTLEIGGLMALPTVTVTDKDGKQMEVTYDETTRTFTERTEVNTISEDEKQRALDAAETYCLWMIEEVTDRSTVAKYFDSKSDIYNVITRLGELWMQGNSGYTFSDETVTECYRYTDSLFSARVSLNLNVTRKDGTVKAYPYDQTLFFSKSDTGKWLAYNMTNVNVSAPVGKVRLTFMEGSTELHSAFFQTDAKEIITPLIPAPEGKVFSGWFKQTVDENGVTNLSLVFQPDETGKVVIPDGTELEPMTLYALFETPEAAASTAAPAATEGA